jgi:ABC-2 type transport system ATP-binding protein
MSDSAKKRNCRSAQSAPTLELDHVTKRYQEVTAVNDLSLQVMPGEIFGLLGPNGAGKTSAIRMMLGIVAPDTGTVRLFGGTADRASLRHAGYLPEERGLYPKMSVHDNLTFFGELNGLDSITAQSQSRTWCERLDLGDRVDDKVESLSKGLQQKVQFIAAILHKPEFIAIDEPFTALDPVNVSQLRELLSEFRSEGRAILLSTHRMDQVEQLCDSICLISHGQELVQGRLREIKSSHPSHCVEIAFDGSGDFLNENPLVASWSQKPDCTEVRLREGADPQELLRAAISATLVRRFEIKEPSVEQIFIKLVGKA